jgi:pilus assembly protein CpaE
MYPLSVGLVIGASNLLEEVRSALAGLPVRTVMEQHEIGEWPAFVEKLAKAEPDVLLIGYQQLADPLEDVVRQIKACHVSPRVVIVNDHADPAVLLRIIRASADEYLYPPLKDDLVSALERVGAEITKQRAGTRPRGKVFGVLSAKGGCGATTIACHLAIHLHRLTNLEVLLADMDLDAGMIGFFMKSQGRYSVIDAIANAHRLDLSFWKALVSNGHPGVEVITAPQTKAGPPVQRLEEFRTIIPFVRANYDWTVVDLGRGLTPLAMNLIDEVDETYVVATLEIPSLHQAKQILQTLLEAGYAHHRLHVLLNRMPKRSEVTLEELDRMLGVPIHSTLPNDYQSLSDAYSEGRLIAQDSHLDRHFARVAAKIAGVQPPRKKRFFLG